ncbi:ATP-binding cassette domain-containing protein [Mangrovibacterium diazotrophicum]|uniref:Molybdate transport system ATP-binding protein n=1 Tax=Mangrovibacterium diazotrophicum TaxID=1261403 RepID=A0A419WAK0_9BACT|nr:ATP-binding cassette domain-containing protein [Mangrovibacterium diazotrophicum]RKD92511.1 molybdate transport system ATP-binding protein [Mangrovibacterium diazotrophicum]
MKTTSSIVARSLVLRSGMTTILNDISFTLNPGESMAITGSSGSGKTSLGRLLAGQILPSSGELKIEGEISRVMVDQQDHFLSLSGQRSTYYGQRYENQGMENSPSIQTYLEKVAAKAEVADAPAVIDEVMETMHIDHLKDRKLLQLSNGERKRTQLAAALLQKPDLMVLDQPFVGLDVDSRAKLTALIQKQMQTGISFALICSPKMIPEGVSQVIELHEGRQLQCCTPGEFQSKIAPSASVNEPIAPELFKGLVKHNEQFEQVVGMKKVQVTIGGKQILKDIDWQVKPGEQWALLGHNGAGKSTLLSLVTADNPQGYVNDLVLFDRKRGSGESIWDIKNRIGFVSPELHQYFLRGEGIFNTIPGLQSKSHGHYDALSCMDVIVSGFKNEIGFASQPTDLERDLAERWFPVLGLSHLQDRLFVQASLGEQRALLLARALVKSPSLLILDEPCQGLDEVQTSRFVNLLEQVCQHLNTTMVYVTHHRNEIPTCVSKLLELEGGQVKLNGTFN